MKNNKKVVAVVITAVAITGSASALANASGSKAKSAIRTTKTTRTTITTVHNMLNPQGMGQMRGHGNEISTVLSDLVSKGTITAAESKAVTDAWSALELAKRTATTAPAPRTPGAIDPELTQALNDLVSKGTLTAAKSKAISDAVTAAEATEAANRPAMGKGPMGGGFMNPNKDAIITATLGIDATTLHNRLAAGESLATIAGAKKDALIAALVADETKQIDAAVTAGKLTAAQATALKADLTAHITAEVNGTFMGGFGGPGRGHEGRGGHDHDGMRGNGQNGMLGGTTNGIPNPSTTTTSAN